MVKHPLHGTFSADQWDLFFIVDSGEEKAAKTGASGIAVLCPVPGSYLLSVSR